MALAPTLLQAYVEKAYEWRITVVGDYIFPCRLDSQKVPEAREDWRMVDCACIEHERHDISPDLSKKLLEYLKLLHLDFGAFDFIETPDGKMIFLECNPNGQWLWVEMMAGMKISEAIARYLFSEDIISNT